MTTDNMLSDEPERAAFEAYALRTIASEDDLRQRVHTGYGSQELNYLWRGWKACADQMRAAQREAFALGAGKDALAAAKWRMLTEAQINEFLEDYEMAGEAEDGRDARHSPSEGERFLIKDAFMGLLQDAEDRALHQRLKANIIESDEILREAGVLSSGGEFCIRAPRGWRCTRVPGHKGPCAAVPDDEAAQPAAPVVAPELPVIPQGAKAEEVIALLSSALNAMLTFFGMDEDADNKEVFDKARQAHWLAGHVTRPLEVWERHSLYDFRDCVHRWHEKAVAKGFDGIEAMCDLAAAPVVAGESFQTRVGPWLLACFGEEIASDKQERNHRFVEEALELAQACDCTASEAHQLVDYVFGRPVGEKAQEVGGVMVTLAALCRAHGIDMHEAGEVELARIWTRVEKIRAKQAAKPKHSPLPEAADQQAEPAARDSGQMHADYGDGFDAGKEHIERELNTWLDRLGAPSTCEDGWVSVPFSLRGRIEVMLSRAAISGTRPVVLDENYASPPPAAPAVPEGMALVPKKPPEWALKRARMAYKNASVYDVLDVWVCIWNELSAAPQQSKEPTP